jgi:hypothetical protein
MVDKGGCKIGKKSDKGGCKIGKKKIETEKKKKFKVKNPGKPLVVKPKPKEMEEKPKPKKKVLKVRNPSKPIVIGKINYDKVEEALDKAFINNFYPDYIEMYLDGRGSEEKQLERASIKVGRAITKLLKKTAKEKKFTTNKQLIDYWIKNKFNLGKQL